MNPFENGLFYSNMSGKGDDYNNFIFLAPVLAIDAISDKAEKKRFENGVANLRKLFPSSTDIETQKKNIEGVRQRTEEYKVKLANSKKAGDKRVNSREVNVGNFRINEMNAELAALYAQVPPPAPVPVAEIPLPDELKAENQPKDNAPASSTATTSTQSGDVLPLNAKSSNTKKILTYAAIALAAVVIYKIVKK